MGYIYIYTLIYIDDHIYLYIDVCVGRDSVVGIETRYRLDGPEAESLWERDFPHPSRPAMGITQPPIQWTSVLSGGKAVEAWRCPPNPTYRRSERKSRALPLFPPLGFRDLF